MSVRKLKLTSANLLEFMIQDSHRGVKYATTTIEEGGDDMVSEG